MKILLVEDESSCRIATTMVLEHLGWTVEAVVSGEAALARFDENEHQLLVTDLGLPGLSGQDLAIELKRKSPTTPVVVYTGAVHAHLESVDAVIPKPASIGDFRKILASLTKAETLA